MKANQTTSSKSEDAPAASVSLSESKPFASTPLVVALLIILIVAILLHGALFAGAYLVENKGETHSGPANADAATPELVVRSDSAQPKPPPVSGTVPAPRPVPQSAFRGSPLAADFFSIGGDPFAHMARMRQQMDRLFEQEFAGPALGTGPSLRGSSTSIREKDGNYVVQVEVPGADEATLDVELTDNVISLRGKREEVRQEQDGHGAVIRHLKSVSSFQRSFVLPGAADAAGMTSDYSDGVLTITVPKI